MVNPNHATEIGKVTSDLDPDNSPDGARADLAVVPGLIPHATLGAGAIGWTTSRILKEVGKQAIDQPGHFLIGAAPIWASRYLVGVPWFGWVAAPILAYREWLQWPSNRWWDPPLDWAFLTLGAVAATWSRRLGMASRSVSQPSGDAWRRDSRSAAGCLSAHEERAGRRLRAQCSSNSRMPPITSRMPITSVRIGRSWKKKTAAAKVNTSSIWPSART